jgi:hypothetical protein
VAGQALTFADNADTLNLTAGAFVSNANLARTIGGTVGNGRLTAGGTLSTGTANFYFTQNQSTITLNSAIVDSGYGAKTRFVYTAYNNAILQFTGTNTYTGGTVLDGSPGHTGTVQLANTAANGTSIVALPAGDLILNRATVQLAGSNQMAFSIVPQINGGGIFDLGSYEQTLAGLVFNNNGSNATPTVNLGGGLATYTGGATTAGDATITMASTAGLAAGMPITGTNIPAGTFIQQVVDGTTVILTQAATGSTGGLTFTRCG